MAQELPTEAGDETFTTEHLSVRVVKTYEERQMAMAIRAAVYLGEKDGRYADHFDENDHCSTMIIAFWNDEPIGMIRCRWYADFARLEKLVIRKPFRRLSVLNVLTKAAMELSRQKGYKVVSGIALPEVIPYWRRMGGRVTGDSFETRYGPVIPVRVPVKQRNDGPMPLSLADLGSKDFEHGVYEWEGRNIAMTMS